MASSCRKLQASVTLNQGHQELSKTDLFTFNSLALAFNTKISTILNSVFSKESTLL